MFVALTLLSCNRQSNDRKIKPVLSDITESAYAPVKVKPAVSYFPQAAHAGVIQEIMVTEGAQVKAGQLLARLSIPASVSNSQSQAAINLEAARADLRGVDNLLLNIDYELKTQREQLLLDSINFFRQKALWAQNIGSEKELEQLALAYEKSNNQFQVLRKQYAQRRGDLLRQYQKAQQQLASEQAQLADFSLRAIMDGMVYALYKEEGELLGVQEQLGEIGSSDAFVLEMEVDETDIAKIQLGDTVALTLDAYGNEVFTATVRKINPRKDDATLTFRVEARFVHTPPQLYYGLAGEANIIVDRRKNALVIPADFLQDGNKVQTSEGLKLVRPGWSNLNFVEIIAGLDTSDLLIQPKY